MPADEVNFRAPTRKERLALDRARERLLRGWGIGGTEGMRSEAFYVLRKIVNAMRTAESAAREKEYFETRQRIWRESRDKILSGMRKATERRRVAWR